MARGWEPMAEVLMTERYGRLMARARVLVVSDDEAADLVQEALVKTFSGAAGFTDVAQAEQYVRRGDRLRVRRRGGPRPAGADALASCRPRRTRPGRRPRDGRGRRGRRGRRRWPACAPRVRACVALRYLEDLSVRETAGTARPVRGGGQALHVGRPRTVERGCSARPSRWRARSTRACTRWREVRDERRTPHGRPDLARDLLRAHEAGLDGGTTPPAPEARARVVDPCPPQGRGQGVGHERGNAGAGRCLGSGRAGRWPDVPNPGRCPRPGPHRGLRPPRRATPPTAPPTPSGSSAGPSSPSPTETAEPRPAGDRCGLGGLRQRRRSGTAWGASYRSTLRWRPSRSGAGSPDGTAVRRSSSRGSRYPGSPAPRAGALRGCTSGAGLTAPTTSTTERWYSLSINAAPGTSLAVSNLRVEAQPVPRDRVRFQFGCVNGGVGGSLRSRVQSGGAGRRGTSGLLPDAGLRRDGPRRTRVT